MGRVYESALRLSATISKTFKPEALSAAAAVARLAGETSKLKKAHAATEQYHKLAGEIGAARERFNAASEALARLKAAEEAAGGATRESTKWRRAGERAVAAAERQLGRATKAAEANAKALRAAGVDSSKLSEEQVRLAAALERTERRARLASTVNQHFGKTLEGLYERAKKYSSVEGSAGKVKEAVGGLISDVTKLVAVGGGAAATLFALAKHTGEVGHELDVTATRLGTTTDALQLLRAAGKRAGVDVEALDTGLGKLSVNLGKVIAAKAKGGKSGLSGEIGGLQFLGLPGVAANNNAVDPFKHLGLSAKALAQQKPEEQVKRIADGIAKLKTHAEQAAAVVQIFGKGGLAMLPLLAKGSKGIEEYYAQARASGKLLTTEQIENAKKFHLAYLQVGSSVEAVRNTLGAALLPVVTKVLGQFNEWISKNRDKVKQWAAQLAAWLEGKAIPAVMKLVPQVVALVSKVVSWIETGARLTGGLGNLAAAIAAVRLLPLVASTGSLIINLARVGVALAPLAAQAGIAFAPFIAAIGPFVALAAALTGVYVAAKKVAEAVDEAQARTIKGDADAKLNAGLEAYQQSAAHKAFVARQNAEQRARLGIPQLRTVPAGGGTLNFQPVINVGEGSRDRIASQIDQGSARAKEAALAAYDAREAQRRRVAFG